MDSKQNLNVDEVRELLSLLIETPETPRKRPMLQVQPTTCIKRWYSRDKVFDGRFSSSGASTPLSPHTPLIPPSTNRQLTSTTLKKPKTKFKIQHRSIEIRELDFDLEDPMIIDSPALTAQRSLMRTDSILSEEAVVKSRYEQDFEELQEIGRGNSGTVYKCKHRYDGLQYAVKQIKTSVSCPLALQEGLREAIALAASSMAEDNFNIIRYFTAWIEQEYLYISMELCECSLLAYISKEGASEDLLKRVMRDVCKGISKLHRKNIVHLDIKTENILYSFSRRFKLSDLGLAQLTTNLNLERDFIEGDSRYLAPEMLNIIDDNAETIPDLTKADMFSLGATFYEIIRGKELPKNGEEWHQIRSEDLCIAGKYSDEFTAVVRSLLSRDPAARPSADYLLDTFLLSQTKQELRRLKLYNAHLESLLADRQPSALKRRKVSI
jgi:wee1-like protein kinase